MRYVASVGEQSVTIEVTDDDHQRQVSFEDERLDVDWQVVGGAALRPALGSDTGHYSLMVGGDSYDVYVRAVPQGPPGAASGAEQVFEVSLAGQPYVVRLEDERTQKLAGLAGAGHEHGEAVVLAPMPGLVSNIMVDVGQSVERGQTVVVLEAMKMENDLGAPRSGLIRSILVTKGQAVNQAQVLAIIADPEGAPAHDDEDE